MGGIGIAEFYRCVKCILPSCHCMVAESNATTISNSKQILRRSSLRRLPQIFRCIIGMIYSIVKDEHEYRGLSCFKFRNSCNPIYNITVLFKNRVESHVIITSLDYLGICPICFPPNFLTEFQVCNVKNSFQSHLLSKPALRR